MHSPQFIAHRGCPTLEPENTLPSMRRAILSGARFLETDVQLSRDEIPVLFHDRSLERLCGKTGAIHEYSFHELQGFRVQRPDRSAPGENFSTIPTLDEFLVLLSEHPETTAFVELKRVSLSAYGIARVLDLVLPRLKTLAPQCVLISFSIEALSCAKERGWRRIGAVLATWEQRTNTAIQTLEAEFLFCAIENVPDTYTHPGGDPKLAVYDVSDIAMARALCARGIEYIETSNVAELIDAAAESEPPHA